MQSIITETVLRINKKSPEECEAEEERLARKPLPREKIATLFIAPWVFERSLRRRWRRIAFAPPTAPESPQVPEL